MDGHGHMDIDMRHDQRSINVSLVREPKLRRCTSCKSCVPPSIAALAHDRGEARQWSRELRPCSRQAMLLRCARLLRRDGAGRGGHHGQVTFTPVEVVLASPGKNVNDTQSRLVSFVREGKLKNP